MSRRRTSLRTEKFTGELLPVIDSLERALELADRDNETLKPVMEGVELTLRAMLTTVGKFGVEQVNPMGDAFDQAAIRPSAWWKMAMWRRTPSLP